MIKTFFKSLNKLTTKKQKLGIYLLFIGSFIAMILESIGLGLVGVYVAIISDPGTIVEKIPILELKLYFSSLSKTDLIKLTSFFLVFVFIIKNLYLIIYLYFEKKLNRSIIISNSEKLYDYYLKKPYQNFILSTPQKLVNNINHVLKLGVNHFFYGIILFRELILTIILFTSFIFVSWKLSIGIFLLLASITFLIYFFVKKRLNKLGKVIVEASQAILKNLNDGFREIKILQILKNYDFFINKLKSILYLRETNEMEHSILQRIPRSLLEIFAIILVVIFTFFLIEQFQDPIKFLPLLATLSLILIRMVPSFSNINFAITNLKYTSNAKSKLIEDLDEKTIFLSTNSIFKNNKKKFNFTGKNLFSFSDIEFYYETKKNKILNEVSLEFNSNQIIGFVGKSGSGKTTLVDIFIGLLKPTNGKIQINNNEIDLFYLEDWQKKIGYVPQDVYLNNKTIKENIAYGVKAEDIDESKVFECIKKADLIDFINHLPNGINTVIRDFGTNISGGQKQRLGIARAMYNKPQILVLDEATSSLDETTEKNILENLKLMVKELTVILIAHKFSTIKYCDHVFHLEDGKILYSGKSEKMLENYFNTNNDS